MKDILSYGIISCQIRDKNHDIIKNPLKNKYENSYSFDETNCSLENLQNFLLNEKNNKELQKLLKNEHILDINFEIRTQYLNKNSEKGFAKPLISILDIKNFDEAFYYLPELKNFFDITINSPIFRDN